VHWSLEGRPVLSDGDFRKRQIVFNDAIRAVYDDSTSLRVEGCDDTVFSKVNSQFNELPMQIFDRLVWVLIEWILKWVRHVLIQKSERGGVFFSITEIDGVLMSHILEFFNLTPEVVILLFVFEVVFFCDQHLLYLLVLDTKHPEWKLRPLHLMYQRLGWCHLPK